MFGWLKLMKTWGKAYVHIFVKNQNKIGCPWPLVAWSPDGRPRSEKR